jgi:hypothetical protein
VPSPFQIPARLMTCCVPSMKPCGFVPLVDLSAFQLFHPRYAIAREELSGQTA